ncbi:MAG: NAD(P)/FAD-dependent oxidoreductase [bacterium]|nr:NAD(P)/FAD-dependent oxidoreductase [bacterium]
MKKSDDKKIVILGGGFGGVRAALDLSRKLPGARIVLADRRSYHSYYSDMYELSAAVFPGGKVPGKKDFLAIKSTLAIPFKDIFSGRKNVEVKEDAVLGAEPKKNEVILSSGRISYDFLIIALGSETNFFGIPHLGEKSHEFKTTADALNLRSKLEELFLSSSKRDKISVVIGGGGFTGTELAGELAFTLPKLAKSHGYPPENARLVLAEGASRLLSLADPWFGKKAEKRLRKIGVEVMLGSFIIDVKDGKILLKDGREVPYSLLVWTAGVKANSLAENLGGFSLEKNKCVMVDKNLKPLGIENVFVVGDLASCGLPMTAQVAIDQGRYVANFLAKALGGQPADDFHPRGSRFIVPLGGKYALADLGFMKLAGFIPWLLKRFVALKYFASILPFGKAFALWSRGLGVFMRND